MFSRHFLLISISMYILHSGHYLYVGQYPTWKYCLSNHTKTSFFVSYLCSILNTINICYLLAELRKYCCSSDTVQSNNKHMRMHSNLKFNSTLNNIYQEVRLIQTNNHEFGLCIMSELKISNKAEGLFCV